MLKQIISILLIISIIFPQDLCDGVCLSETEAENLFHNIKECEFNKEKCLKKVENLDSQIYMYIRSDSLYQSQIEDYKKQIELQEEMIKTIKPKWHENKYLWYGYGVLSVVVPIYLTAKVGVIIDND
tara:strand:+ start:182 stop:562 length:381 start_codon:yes stop_codon:yes gene_type:complete